MSPEFWSLAVAVARAELFAFAWFAVIYSAWDIAVVVQWLVKMSREKDACECGCYMLWPIWLGFRTVALAVVLGLCAAFIVNPLAVPPLAAN